MKPSNDAFLRGALRANASFSALSGLGLLVAAGPLAPLLGIPAIALRVVGLGLLPFAASLWRMARRERLEPGEARLAVGLDLAWVVGSVVLVTGELWPLAPLGIGAVLGVAAVVLLWAVLQMLGLRRLRPVSSS